MQLTEKYRPRTWSDVIGQEKVIGKLLALRSRGELGGRAYFISGKSGQGKTTIARLIAAELAEGWNVEEMDAGEVTAEAVRRIEGEMNLFGMGSKLGRVWIVNEAHGLNAIQVRKLLTLLEPGSIPAHVAFCFTTTKEGHKALFEGCDDSGPLLSRCTVLKLNQQGINEQFAARAREIAKAENMDGLPIERYSRLVKDCNGNMRAVLMAIDSGELSQ